MEEIIRLIPKLLRSALVVSGGLFLSGLLGMGYAVAIEPHWLQIERVEVTLSRLPAEFTGYRIVQLSDLHLYRYNSPDKIRRAVDLALGLNPDLIVLTGDYVSSLRDGEAGALERELSRLSAPDGVFAVLGNHDWWTDNEMVAAALQRANVILLRNENVAILRGKGVLYLAGVDDIWEHKDNLPQALLGIPVEAGVILLAHEPDFAETAATDRRILLQLSGHTHGGQVRFPGMEAFAKPRWGRLYTNGLYAVGNMHLYVTRGVGVIFPPLRFFCRPEVTQLRLYPEIEQNSDF
jgi:hypothetical protein